MRNSFDDKNAHLEEKKQAISVIDNPDKIADTVLEKILEIDNIERVRVSSAYPDTITDKFLHMLKNNPKLMPHLHVSIQTIDDKILPKLFK